MHDDPTPGPVPRDRLDALRAELGHRGLTGFIVPRADEHQGEYVPPHAQRLAWLTGFTGSAGAAVVLAGKAAIFVDGRYTIQVRQEVDTALFEPQHLVETPPPRWLGDMLVSGDRLGVDPWLHTPDNFEALRQACERAGAELVPCPDNPVDAVWHDRPARPSAPVVAHDLRHAGRTAEEKRQEIAAALRADRLDAALLSDPASVAWLLNIRGDDVAYTPLPLAFAIVHSDAHVDLFMEPERLSGVADHLGAGVTASAPAALLSRLDGLDGKRVRLDAATAPFAAMDRLTRAGARIDKGADPCALPKACKNPTELDGCRAAHRRDGAALARFLCWLSRQDGIDELGAAAKLEDFRRSGELFKGLSFPTIAGSGPNGAIVHYRSTAQSNRMLRPGELFLLDSGAQYLDGTTDVTRTIAIGQPGIEERRRYTLVLKGHIAIATALFPVGTAGPQLDILARRPLWAEGLDYDHGTGHGVGSYLSVHEGPQRISKAGHAAMPLKPGMILSNEPGYYKAGSYGIRIENLVAVAPAPAPMGGERDLLRFETLTLAPFDRALIEPGLLDADERAWVDGYHAGVLAAIGPMVEAEVRSWLEFACAPL